MPPAEIEAQDAAHPAAPSPGERAAPAIFRRALGDDFDRLHPQLQRWFGSSSRDHVACIGRGTMDWIRLGPWYTWPFLSIGSRRRIMFAADGENVPFTVENYAYLDGFGRETLTWIRTFDLAPPRQFDERMVFSEKRGRIVVYAGSHQHLAVELHARVDDEGAMRMRTGAQRIYEGPLAMRFPLILSGSGSIRVWYDDRAARFGVDVDVRNRFWGPVFQYRGWFEIEYRRCAPSDVLPHARPNREERRE